jgi:epoxyqueuosine reductase
MKLSRTEREWIENCARAKGFALCGVASVPDDESPEAAIAEQRFAEWVLAGRAGEMEYLKRADETGGFLRGGLRRAIPWARSVVVCAVNYNTEAPRSIDPAAADSGWIARYAWSGNDGKGSDYHDVLLEKLHSIEAEILGRFGGETRCYVDTGPIVERDYAARVGVGWIGKNTCILNQEQGSWLLLGVIVMSLEQEREAWTLPAADRCGTCTRCIDACPTEALLWTRENPERAMDASRCIAYLTIEKKGSIDVELREKLGRQVFGCDICQDVCPWNHKAPVAIDNAMPARMELVNPALEWLGAMDGAEFNRWFRGSPLERTRRKRVLRNVAIAMGNSGETKFLPRLAEWAAGEDAVLAESAAWAAEKITSPLRDQVNSEHERG